MNNKNVLIVTGNYSSEFNLNGKDYLITKCNKLKNFFNNIGNEIIKDSIIEEKGINVIHITSDNPYKDTDYIVDTVDQLEALMLSIASTKRLDAIIMLANIPGVSIKDSCIVENKDLLHIFENNNRKDIKICCYIDDDKNKIEKYNNIDLFVLDKLSYTDEPGTYYINKNREAFKDLTPLEIMEELGLFNREIKFMNSPGEDYLNDFAENDEIVSIKKGSVTQFIDKNGGFCRIDAVLEQNDSNDINDKYILGKFKEDREFSDYIWITHNLHIKNEIEKIKRCHLKNGFFLGINTRVLDEEENILDYDTKDLNSIQTILTLKKVDNTRKLNNNISTRYIFNNNYNNDENIVCEYNKIYDNYTIINKDQNEIIGNVSFILSDDLKTLKFTLSNVKSGHHIIEKIAKTFSDITIINNQPELKDFLVEKYGFERTEEDFVKRELV